MATYINSFLNWVTGQSPVPSQGQMQREAFYAKREFLNVPKDRSFESQWELPAVNPVLDVMSHGMEIGAPTNTVRRSAVSYDPRGEPDVIKGLKEVDVPNFLIDDRIYSAAVERSELRDITPESAKYGV